jgi:hypothetical protein
VGGCKSPPTFGKEGSMWSLEVYVKHNDRSISKEFDGDVRGIVVIPQIGDTVIFDDVEYIVYSRIIDIFNEKIIINATNVLR